jgi:hypothetical protein
MAGGELLMKIELRIDNMLYMIDSKDPDLLARWLVEQFAGREWYASTYCTVQCWPSWGPPEPGGPPGQGDWIMDSRYQQQWAVKSPRDVLAGMQRALDDLDQDRAARPR